jgi:capsular polysaccharide biosynthesis protein
LRRNAIIILVLTVAAGLLAYQYASSRPAQYEAKVRVLLNPTPGNPYSPDSGQSGQQVTIAMTTEASIVDSAAVAKISNDKLATDWVPGTGTVTAVVPANTQMVTITYRAAKAEDARQGAQAVADGFLEYRKQQAAATQKARLEVLQKQVTTVQAALTAAAKRVVGVTPPPEAVQQVQLYANQLATLQTSIGDLQATGAVPGSVVAAAALPAAPTGLDPRVVAAGGALAGLVLALLLAMLRQRTDKRVYGAQTGRVAGVPVLAGSPRTGLLAGLRAPSAEDADAVNRLLRTAILAGLPAPSALGVSPISGRLSGSVLTLEVAQLIAEAGYRVTVVDATPDGRLSRETGLEGHDGLAQVLSADPRAVGDYSQTVGNVQVLPTGGDLAEVQELLSGRRFSALVDAALADCDYVIVATGPANTPAAMGIARVVGHLVLVGEDVRTTSKDVEQASLRARQAKVGILGLTLLPKRSRLGRAASVSSRRQAKKAALPAVSSRAETSAQAPRVVDPTASITATSALGHADAAEAEGSSGPVSTHLS